MYTVLDTHVGLLISGAGKHALEKTMKKLILPTNIIISCLQLQLSKLPYT
jgi:hypothetical protein